MGILHGDNRSHHDTLQQAFASVDYSKLNKASPLEDDDDNMDYDPIIDPDPDPDPNDVPLAPLGMHPKLQQMVAAMIKAVPSLSKQHALHFLLHTAQGRKLAEHLNSISKTERQTIMNRTEEMQEMKKFVKGGGMPAIAKRVVETGATNLTEHEYTTLVLEDALLRKISFEKAFQDPTTQQAYAIVREAGFIKTLAANGAYPQLKGTASLTPTSTESGSSSVADDTAKAVRQLQQLADSQRRTFEQVFSDPANIALARRTYRRPLTGSTTGEADLQR